MDKQPPSKTTEASQAKPWSDAELRRVARVFELLIRIDKRKKGQGNERQQSNPDAPASN
jgi:hypothetical protein